MTRHLNKARDTPNLLGDYPAEQFQSNCHEFACRIWPKFQHIGFIGQNLANVGKPSDAWKLLRD